MWVGAFVFWWNFYAGCCPVTFRHKHAAELYHEPQTELLISHLSSCSFFPRFLLQCLEDLDANLRKLNSRLFVIRGQPANVFPRLFKVSMLSSIQQGCPGTCLMSFPVCVSGMEDLTADLRVRLGAFWEGERCCHQEAGHGGRRGGHCEDITHPLRPGQVRKLSFWSPFHTQRPSRLEAGRFHTCRGEMPPFCLGSQSIG